MMAAFLLRRRDEIGLCSEGRRIRGVRRDLCEKRTRSPGRIDTVGRGLRAGRLFRRFIGGHYVTAPIWNQVRFQPNVEAGFGDDRTVVAFNVEFAYWMSVSPDWHVYVGGGPAMNLFSGNGNDHGDNDDLGPGLTVLAGLRRRGGLFFEMKVGAFDSPDFKLTVGYTF
jgi:hypothetical protein